MTRHRLLPTLATALLFLIALNALLLLWGHRQAYVHKLEKLRTAANPDLLFLGNSLLDGHLDECALAASIAPVKRTPINAALGATEPPEHLLLFRYARRLHPHLRTLVLGYYDFQLTTPDQTPPLGLIGNRMVGLDHRFPLAEVASVYHSTPRQRMTLAVLRNVPMLADRTNAWKDVELLRRHLAAMGMPPVASNAMGRVDDFAALESDSTAAFDARADQFLRGPLAWNPSYTSLFAEARAAKIRIVLVLMPASPWYRSRFYSRSAWSPYRAAVESLAQREQMATIDASNWLAGQTDFEDHLHMSPAGVTRFSTQLGQQLRAMHLDQ
jgi:hypothetical protein